MIQSGETELTIETGRGETKVGNEAGPVLSECLGSEMRVVGAHLPCPLPGPAFIFDSRGISNGCRASSCECNDANSIIRSAMEYSLYKQTQDRLLMMASGRSK